MTLYPYQQRVKSLLLAGESVILQAPTGTGKTRAALAPYIEAYFEHTPEAFPRKCIYSVPMRVLANQFHNEDLYDPTDRILKLSERVDRRYTISTRHFTRPKYPSCTSRVVPHG
jgi:CRISPR-associated endonuclease/helicase Cas3